MKRFMTVTTALLLCVSLIACSPVVSQLGSKPENNDYFGSTEGYWPPANEEPTAEPPGKQNTQLAYRLDYYRDHRDIYSYYTVPVDSYDYTGLTVTLPEGASADFIQWVKEQETVYDRAGDYQLEQALQRYEQTKDVSIQVHDNALQAITPQALMERVKENNALYLQQDDIKLVASMYNQFSDGDLLKICTIICDTANFYIDQGIEEDPEQVRCVLGDLKIFDRPVMSNAYVTDDNCLTVSTNLIGTMEIKLDEKHKDQDVFYGTISHETTHMLQKGCKHSNEQVYRIGFAYQFEEMSIHPMFTGWFYEGAAEQMVVNTTGYMPIVYEGSIKRIHAMTLSTVLRPENTVTTIEETTLQHSLKPLFDAFGCTTQAERTELMNMMFSLQLLLIEDEAFMSTLAHMTDGEKSDVWQAMKSDVGMTLAKHFYQNLAQLLQEQPMPLNDVFYLITVLEQEMNSSLRLSDEHRQAVSQPMLDSYKQMQDRFFGLLAQGCGMTQQELADRYLAYELATPDKTANCDLSYLPEEKQVFVHFLCSTNYLSGIKLRTLAS